MSSPMACCCGGCRSERRNPTRDMSHFEHRAVQKHGEVEIALAILDPEAAEVDQEGRRGDLARPRRFSRPTRTLTRASSSGQSVFTRASTTGHCWLWCIQLCLGTTATD